MAAPQGNKFAVGHGRPPNEGYSDQEVLKLGHDLLEWMRKCDQDDNCDVVHLSEFYSEIKGIAPSYWEKSLTRRPCFSEYYEKAMIWMGKRLLKNKKLAPSYGNRFIPIYFREVREIEFDQERRKIDYIAEKKTSSVYDPDTLHTFDGLMAQFKSVQSTSRIAEISNNEESKSE